MGFQPQTTEEKIAFLRSRIKTVIISTAVWSVLLAVAAVLLWCLASLWQLAFIIAVSIPVYVYFACVVKVKQFKKEISNLEDADSKKTKKR